MAQLCKYHVHLQCAMCSVHVDTAHVFSNVSIRITEGTYNEYIIYILPYAA